VEVLVDGDEEEVEMKELFAELFRPSLDGLGRGRFVLGDIRHFREEVG